MRKHSIRIALAFSVPIALVASLSACSGGSSGGTTVDPKAKVTITVGDYPAASQTAQVEAFDKAVTAFEKANPNITVKTDTFAYNADTFAAALASGNLPTTYYVPFTEPQALIKAGAVADVTSALKQIGLYDDLNKDVLDKMSDSKGNAYGIPTGVYSVGLNYNRSIFQQAGLDPDKPPTTFDEVRTDAKIIKDKTGIPGFGSMASGSGGGWTLTALTYAFGGRIENAAGTKATMSDGGTADALKLIQGMREDGSMSNYIGTDFTSFGTDFAAEKYAMYIGCPCWYGNTVNSKGLAPEDWGSAGMPTSPDANATLAGGGLNVVNGKATPEQVLAATKWVKYFLIDPQLTKDAAVATAKAAAADGQPVGVPTLSLFSEDRTAEVASWIKPYVNVPVANFQPWQDSIAKVDLVAEPSSKAQDVYKLLDVLMQTVISKPSTDVDAAVKDYDSQLNALLSR